MMHHQPLPFPLFGQYPPSWPDIYSFAKPDSWPTYSSYPYPSPSRRRPHSLLEHTSSSTTSKSHSPRTKGRPLRAQVPPALSALPALPIPFPMPALERESPFVRFGLVFYLRSVLAPSISPLDPGSPMSTTAPLTPAPEFLHVVCNAPLLAPKPLPYRPPAFLDSFELPDPDEDLSHPPYTRTSSKRKRGRDAQDDGAPSSFVSKRRATETVFRGLNGLRSQRRFSK
jgi:hypothetical protein